MSSYRIINKKRWYYRLKPRDQSRGLFSDFPRNSLKNKLIVCWDFPNENKNQKLYSFFNSYIDFCFFFLGLEPKFRTFYEIILGETIQKPHFDIDMEGDEADKKVLEDLCNAILLVLSEKGVNLDLKRDICIYSSHGENKKSYHLVINNYCHTNNKEAKAFYYHVVSKLPIEYVEKKWIDSAVYSKTQQFRLLGSSKGGSNRYKKLELKWELNGKEILHVLSEKPEDERHEFLLQLEESLITGRISTCNLLPFFEIPEDSKKYKRVEDIHSDLARKAIFMLAEKAGISPEDKSFPYRFDRVEGPFVILKRVKPSRCRLCSRIHHNQNPYLLITPQENNVFFHCRRAPPGKNWFIGCLKEENDIVEVKNEWVQQKLEQLKEIASSAVPKKEKVIYDPKVVLERMLGE